MSPTVTAAQRNALYDQILDHLSGIGDIELAIEAGNYDDAERLGREYSDDLRLLLDDLGLGDGDSGSVELTSPPDVLRRVLGRLRERAIAHIVGQQRELAEVELLRDRNRLVSQACTSVLADLGEPGPTAGHAERTGPIMPPG